VIYEQSMNSGFGQSPRLLSADHAGYPKVKCWHGGFDAWKRRICL